MSLAKLNLGFNNRFAKTIQNFLFSFTSLLQKFVFIRFCSGSETGLLGLQRRVESHIYFRMGGNFGNWTEDKAAESHEGSDTGRAGRPCRTVKGLYIAGREGSDLAVYCDADGHVAMSGRLGQ